MSEAAAAPAASATPSATPAQPGTQEAQAAQAAPSKPELFEYKINGKTVKLNAQERDQYVSLGFASDDRFKSAAQMRKEAESVIGKFKDPKKVISALQDPALGLSKDQIREAFEEWYSAEFIDAEKLTPEQKKLKEYEAKLQKYSDDEKGREEQKQKEYNDSLTDQARQDLQHNLIEALKVSDLSPTNFTVRRLAFWTEKNRQNGFDAPPAVLAGQVRKELTNVVRDITQASDGETLIKMLGDEVIQKLRKYDLEQLRKTRSQPAGTQQQQETSPGLRKPDERAPTSADVNQRIRQLQKTGRY